MAFRSCPASWKELSEKKRDPDAPYPMTGRMQLIGPPACNRPEIADCIVSMLIWMNSAITERLRLSARSE